MKRVLFCFLIIFALQGQGETKVLAPDTCRYVFAGGSAVVFKSYLSFMVNSGFLDNPPASLETALVGLGAIVIMPLSAISSIFFIKEIIKSGRGPIQFLRSQKERKLAITVPLLEKALEKGLDINQQDSYGNTLLHYAEHKKGIAFLMEAGANPFIKNKKGYSALEYHQLFGHFDVYNHLRDLSLKTSF